MIYVKQLIWPVPLAVFYPHPQDTLPSWEIVLAILLLALASAAAIALRRKYPYFITGWFWYLVMLLPVIGLIQVGSQAHADRYTYLPQIGLCIVATWGVVDLSRSLRWPREIFSVAAPLVIVVFAGWAWIQTSYWHDTERLWS